MEDNAPCKKITFSQPEGSRKKGRPKLRWLDSVLKDLKILTVTDGGQHRIEICGVKSSRRPRHTKGCSAEEEEEEENILIS
jgi:hypothetical protein